MLDTDAIEIAGNTEAKLIELLAMFLAGTREMADCGNRAERLALCDKMERSFQLTISELAEFPK